MDDEIDPEEVHALLADSDDVRVVDIRDEASFERGHIPDSENLPFHELSRRIDELDGADRVVTVCPHGKASVQAARLIGSYEGCADATVESMAGGLDEWAESYELVADEGDGAEGDAAEGDAAKRDAAEGGGSDDRTADAPF